MMSPETAREVLKALEGGIGAEPGTALMRTDLSNAERLVAAHGHDLRHVRGSGWLAWDDRRFRRDEDGAVIRRAKQTVRGMYEDAARLEDADARKELVSWAIKSASEPRLRAMVAMAESEETVVASASALDARPFLLNVDNGTVDLTTGELREHRCDGTRASSGSQKHLLSQLPRARGRAWPWPGRAPRPRA